MFQNKLSCFVKFSLSVLVLFAFTFGYFLTVEKKETVQVFSSWNVQNARVFQSNLTGIRSKKSRHKALDMPMIVDIAKQHLWMVSDRPTEEKIMQKCSEIKYDPPSTLPTIAVIITFHQTEKLTHMLHTIHSIVKHSPAEVLKEIILIADKSSKAEHQHTLQNYVSAVFPGKVKIHRSNVSLGLIKARALGVELATADVVCGLDSHMEVQKGWLEPILQEIKNNRKTMITPYLDWMKPQKDGSWIYEHGSSRYKTVWFWGGMYFTFMEIPKEFKSNEDQTAAIVSPCSVGIFAMERKFFHEIGGLDPGMQFWGGENIDLSLRTFLFGGRHVQLPCSHVAHLEEPGQRDYRAALSVNTDINYIRVVETWFTPEYKDVIYFYNPSWKKKSPGDLSERLKLKERATYNFTYYMKNYYPEMKSPFIDSFAWGGLKNLGMANQMRSLACALVDLAAYKVIMSNCNNDRTGIFWTNSGELRLHSHIIHPPVDLGYSEPTTQNYVTVYGTDKIPKFLHVKDGFIKVYKKGTDICLTVINPEEKPRIVAKKCNTSDPFQQWRFNTYTKQYQDLSQGSNIKPEYIPFVTFMKQYKPKVIKPNSKTIEKQIFAQHIKT